MYWRWHEVMRFGVQQQGMQIGNMEVRHMPKPPVRIHIPTMATHCCLQVFSMEVIVKPWRMVSHEYATIVKDGFGDCSMLLSFEVENAALLEESFWRHGRCGGGGDHGVGRIALNAPIHISQLGTNDGHTMANQPPSHMLPERWPLSEWEKTLATASCAVASFQANLAAFDAETAALRAAQCVARFPDPTTEQSEDWLRDLDVIEEEREREAGEATKRRMKVQGSEWEKFLLADDGEAHRELVNEWDGLLTELEIRMAKYRDEWALLMDEEDDDEAATGANGWMSMLDDDDDDEKNGDKGGATCDADGGVGATDSDRDEQESDDDDDDNDHDSDDNFEEDEDEDDDAMPEEEEGHAQMEVPEEQEGKQLVEEGKGEENGEWYAEEDQDQWEEEEQHGEWQGEGEEQASSGDAAARAERAARERQKRRAAKANQEERQRKAREKRKADKQKQKLKEKQEREKIRKTAGETMRKKKAAKKGGKKVKKEKKQSKRAAEKAARAKRKAEQAKQRGGKEAAEQRHKEWMEKQAGLEHDPFPTSVLTAEEQSLLVQRHRERALRFYRQQMALGGVGGVLNTLVRATAPVAAFRF